MEDLDFNEDADGEVIKVVYPDPGGLPNIRYDEKNTTDVPMNSMQSTGIVMPSERFSSQMFTATFYSHIHMNSHGTVMFSKTDDSQAHKLPVLFNPGAFQAFTRFSRYALPSAIGQRFHNVNTQQSAEHQSWLRRNYYINQYQWNHPQTQSRNAAWDPSMPAYLTRIPPRHIQPRMFLVVNPNSQVMGAQVHPDEISMRAAMNEASRGSMVMSPV